MELQEGFWVSTNFTHRFHLSHNWSYYNPVYYDYDGDYVYLPYDYYNYSGDYLLNPSHHCLNHLHEDVTRYFLPCLLALGFAGQLATIVILMGSSTLRTTSRGVYVIATTLFDFLVLLLLLLRAEPLVGGNLFSTSDAACRLSTYLLHLSDCGHHFVALIVVDSFFAVQAPTLWKKIRGWEPAVLISIFPVVLVGLYSCHTIPQVGIFEITGVEFSESFCHFLDEDLSRDWIKADMIVLVLLPMTAMVMFSGLLIIGSTIRKESVGLPASNQASNNTSQETRVVFMPDTSTMLASVVDTSAIRFDDPAINDQMPRRSNNNNNISSSSSNCQTYPPRSRDWPALPLSLVVLTVVTCLPITCVDFYSLSMDYSDLDAFNTLYCARIVLANVSVLVHALKLFFFLACWRTFRQAAWSPVKSAWNKVLKKEDHGGYHSIVAADR